MADSTGSNPVPDRPENFPEIARSIVFTEVLHSDVTYTAEDLQVYVVWFSFIMGNWKALVSTNIPNGLYYEVTSGPRGTFLDTYGKLTNKQVLGVAMSEQEVAKFDPDARRRTPNVQREEIHEEAVERASNLGIPETMPSVDLGPLT